MIELECSNCFGSGIEYEYFDRIELGPCYPISCKLCNGTGKEIINIEIPGKAD